MKRFFSVIVIAFIMMAETLAQTTVTRHEVQGGETLYSLSRRYNVTVEQIVAANPGMGEKIYAGQVINIPAATNGGNNNQAANNNNHVTTVSVDATFGTTTTANTNIGECKLMYQVEKKETVYSISRKFNITEEELLRANPQIKKEKVKKGEYLCIPYSASEIAALTKAEEEEKKEEVVETVIVTEKKPFNVAVILPFGLDNKQKTSEEVKMIDFYEGFLVGVNDMKREGISVNVYAYDEGGVNSTATDSILKLESMKNMDFIVGPLHLEHYPAISAFATKNNICLALPFSTRDYLTTAKPTVFQINNNVATLYAEVYDQFTTQFPNSDVCFIDINDKGSKSDFVAGMKRVLESKGMKHRTITVDQIANIKDMFSDEHRNVIIPTSASMSAFESIIKKMNNLPANIADSLHVTFFGYPEWQTFTDADEEKLVKYKSSFFATFYAYKNDNNINAFRSKFTHWFKREPVKAHPDFSLLGYDIARYFINGLSNEGTEFYNNQANHSCRSLQNPMQFRRKAEGSGFVNTHVKIIHL